MDFLLQIQEFAEGPIGDLLVQLRTGGIQFPELPALPNISLTPQLTLPENIQVGDLGSTFGDFSPADMSSGDNGSSQLSSGDNEFGSSNFLSELSSGDNQGEFSTDLLGDLNLSELSSGDNQLSTGDNQLSTDFFGDLDLSELSSGDNQGSTDFLGDFSELSSGDNQGSTDFLGDFSELSSGDNGSTDLADLSQLSGENGSSDILDLDLSDLLDLDGELNLPDIPQSI